MKFGGQPLPGATVIATQGNHRAVTTTDESGNYELPDLAPGTYTVEVQMFGFQTAHKEVQIASGAPPVEWSLDLQSRPRELAERPRGPQAGQQAGFRATAESEVDQLAAAPPPDIAPQNSANANEAFLVNGTLSTGLQNDQNDFGLRGPLLGMQGPPGGLGGLGVQGQPGGVPGAPGGPGGGGPGGGGAGQDLAVADVVVGDSAGQEAAIVPEAMPTAGSSAIAEIAGVRAFMATCPSSGRARPPTPSSSR